MKTRAGRLRRAGATKEGFHGATRIHRGPVRSGRPGSVPIQTESASKQARSGPGSAVYTAEIHQRAV